MRIAVIGAGVSGLTAAKCCADEGLTPVVFEQSRQIGGLWRFTEEESHSSIMRTTVINTSKEMMCFSDFPMPESYPTFLPHRLVLQYLEDYAEHFKLLQYVRFGCRIVSVEPERVGEERPESAGGPGGRWRIRWESTHDESGTGASAAAEELFDAVMVCTGHHWKPRTPAFPGADTFKGVQVHSHAYKDDLPYRGKRVVVVGIGNSGADIAVELSRAAAQVELSTRSGTWVFPRYLLNTPFDHMLSRLVSTICPLWVRTLFMEKAISLTHGSVKDFGLRPKHRIFQAHPTIHSELLGRIGTGTIAVRPDVAELHPDAVSFADGTRVKADAIIYCTGYEIEVPFVKNRPGGNPLSVGIGPSNSVRLYKHMLPLEGPPTLAFIGLVQPLGAIMPISEIQARWFARLLKGLCRLPPREEMARDVERREAAVRARYKPSPRHTVQVDYLDYMEEIAGLVGCRPRLSNPLVWLRSPRVALATLVGPASPVHFRLRGPGAWAGAPDAVLRMAGWDKGPSKAALGLGALLLAAAAAALAFALYAGAGRASLSFLPVR
eukprot:tig00020806_g14034.t1